MVSNGRVVSRADHRSRTGDFLSSNGLGSNSMTMGGAATCASDHPRPAGGAKRMLERSLHVSRLLLRIRSSRVLLQLLSGVSARRW